MSILSIKDLSYQYCNSKKLVLNKINIDFELGKMYAIVGKSGSGKTTFLSLISGLDISSNGSILYCNKDLRSINRDRFRARDIGVVFQNYNLLQNATVIENLVLSMNISGVLKEKQTQIIEDVLKKVGIDSETASKKLCKLSGGEQQRVGIARAISHNPDIIIADEPTSNLDSENEESIMKILASLVEHDNKCVIIVSHSTKVASYANEIWGISNGRILFIQ